MRAVSVIGVGIHRFGRFPDKDFREMGRIATLMALKDAGMSMKKIEAAFCGTAYAGSTCGMRTLGQVGLTGIPIVDVENACVSGGSAFRLAYQAVATGLYDIVLALGIEKMPKGFMVSPRYEEWHRDVGLAANPLPWVLRARRYMEDYGMAEKHLAMVSVKNHKHGVLNPYAMFQKPLSLDEVMASPLVCDPVRLYMICTPNEGAAAAILCSTALASQYTGRQIRVAASVLNSAEYGSHTGRFGVDFGAESTRIVKPQVTTRTAQQAYTIAGIGPEDLDLVELQDTDASSEILAYEELGLCKEGEAIRLVEEGATEIDGKIPVNVSGGLISKGEPVGASGLGQIFEAVTQLRREAGLRQVRGAQVGMCEVLGGGGNCCITLLKR